MRSIQTEEVVTDVTLLFFTVNFQTGEIEYTRSDGSKTFIAYADRWSLLSVGAKAGMELFFKENYEDSIDAQPGEVTGGLFE